MERSFAQRSGTDTRPSQRFEVPVHCSGLSFIIASFFLPGKDIQLVFTTRRCDNAYTYSRVAVVAILGQAQLQASYFTNASCTDRPYAIWQFFLFQPPEK